MDPLWIVPGMATLLALLSLWGALRAGRRQRLLDHLPTCRTTGVFIGLVELKGTAEAETPLISYLAERPCVHYAYTVEEHWSRTVTETYTDRDGKQKTRTRHESGWTTVAEGAERGVFYLQDEAGVIRVNPARAEIQPAEIFDQECGRGDRLYYAKGPRSAVWDSDHRRRFREEAIPLHAAIYVVGPARERADVVAAEIRHDRDEPLFLISTRSERQVRAGYAWTFWGLGGLAVMLAVGGGLALDVLRGLDAGARLAWYAALLAIGLGTWVLGWGWMAYNSLVNLRQRVRQAWANIDVQLKRRHDLIPRLVRVVEGLRDHERQVQEQLAALRAQAAATPPGDPGPDPQGCLPLLRIIVERYPALKADAAFGQLQGALVDTEQRIALARGYFNEVATFYNTRLETVPDRCLGALARLRPQALLAATDFERAPVRVELTE